MKNETKWLIAVIIAALIGIFVLCSDIISGERNVLFEWNYYPTYGSSDAAFLTIYEISGDSTSLYNLAQSDMPTILAVIKDSISVFDSTLAISIEDIDEVRFFTMTATDTAFNQSMHSDIAILDASKPKTAEKLNVRFID